MIQLCVQNQNQNQLARKNLGSSELTTPKVSHAQHCCEKMSIILY